VKQSERKQLVIRRLTRIQNIGKQKKFAEIDSLINSKNNKGSQRTCGSRIRIYLHNATRRNAL